SLDVAEQNAGAVLGPERSDRRFDGTPQLLGFHRVQRTLLPGSDLERGGLHRFRRFSVRRAVEREGIQLAPSEMIDRRIVGDLEYPGGKFEFGAIRLDGIERLDEGLLGQVLGQLAVAYHSEQESEHRPLI